MSWERCPLHITPGCRLRSLRSLRPTLAWSRHLLRSKGANAAPRLRVRQPETLYAIEAIIRGGPSWAALRSRACSGISEGDRRVKGAVDLIGGREGMQLGLLPFPPSPGAASRLGRESGGEDKRRSLPSALRQDRGTSIEFRGSRSCRPGSMKAFSCRLCGAWNPQQGINEKRPSR